MHLTTYKMPFASHYSPRQVQGRNIFDLAKQALGSPRGSESGNAASTQLLRIFVDGPIETCSLCASCPLMTTLTGCTCRAEEPITNQKGNTVTRPNGSAFTLPLLVASPLRFSITHLPIIQIDCQLPLS